MAIIEKSFEIYLDISEYIDVATETTRLQKEIEKLDSHIASLNKRLQNRNFVENAKPEVVEEQRATFEASQGRVEKLRSLLQEISAWS